MAGCPAVQAHSMGSSPLGGLGGGRDHHREYQKWGATRLERETLWRVRPGEARTRYDDDSRTVLNVDLDESNALRLDSSGKGQRQFLRYSNARRRGHGATADVQMRFTTSVAGSCEDLGGFQSSMQVNYALS